MSQIIPNFDLSYAVSDVYYSQKGGLFRADYDHLLAELRKLQISQNLPRSYQDNVVEPLINYLIYNLPKDRFDYIFSTHEEDLIDPIEKNIKSFFPILAEALLQRNYQQVYYRSAFDDLLAFQSIVDTIFNLSTPTISTPVPPLVAWSQKRKGPFTMTAAKIEGNIQIPIGIVCLPPECRNGGLFSWSVMGHEVAGHNFIQSKHGLLDELTSKVTDAIEKRLKAKLKVEDAGYVKILSDYWSKKQRVEELSSDLLGILSTGPSLAIGCIGYFRGMSQNGFLKTRGPFEAQKKRDVLDIQGEGVNIRLKELSKKVKFEESHGSLGNTEAGKEFKYRVYKIPSGPHPIQALRPFAMVEAIKQTNLDKKLQEIWAQLITNEVLSKEFSKEQFVKIIKINPNSLLEEETCIPFQVACISAEIVANIITTIKLEILGKKKITEVFNWTTKDERLVESVRICYQKNLKSLDRFVSTNHIVAAAIMEASILNSNIEGIFQTMKQHLIQIQGKV